MRRLQTRFVLAGGLLVAATVIGSAWSALTFARLEVVVGNALRVSQGTIDRTAELAGSLEREDDALLLVVSGNEAAGRAALNAERRRGDECFEAILASLGPDEDDERAVGVALRDSIDHYRTAGDTLIAGGRPGALGDYHRAVNPLLRQAVAGCDRLREANFRAMQDAALRARAEAGRGTRVVALVALAGVLSGAAVAAQLAWSVLRPIRDLSASVEAVRQGDFDRRVRPTAADELGQLADGFNRMAEALAEYRRSSLGELVTAKMTLEATLNALPDAVLVFGPDGDLVAANPPAQTLLAAKRAGTATRLADLPVNDGHRADIQAALAGRPPPPRRPDFDGTVDAVIGGQPRRFLLSAVPVSGFPAGRFGAVAVLDDVTEFARLDELRSELIGVASHELKSPLTTLRMTLLMLGEGAADLSPRQRELLAAAGRGCEELGGTIEELLDVTRIEAGQLRLNLAPVDPAAVLAAVADGLRPRYDDAGVELVVEQGPRVLVRGDSTRLGIVFTNLLTNALKYSPAGGRVVARVASGQNAQVGLTGSMQITVTDQGPGVPAEYRERVFEKFFRVEHHTAQPDEGVRGTGIGLYLCREIVKAHGGSVICGPGDSGVGTRFELALPAGL